MAAPDRAAPRWAGRAGSVREHWALDAAGNRLPAALDARGARVSRAERQDWARQVRENLHDAGFDLLRTGNGVGEGAGPVTRWPGNRIGWSTSQGPADGQGAGTTRYRYDAFGNRIQTLFPDGRAQQLQYDALHQLREVWQRDGAGSPWRPIASYRYDAFGRRLGKTVHQQPGLDGSTTYAGWDADRLVHNEGPAGLVHTLYEPDSFVPLLRLEREQAIPSAMQALLAPTEEEDIEDGIGQPADLFAALPRSQRELLENTLAAAISPRHGATIAPHLPVEVSTLLEVGLDDVRHRLATSAKAHATRIRHILCDHLGNPIGMVDANGPRASLVTWAATYNAWGGVREEYDPDGSGQAIRFQGQQLDLETGLHYNRFRYYDPRVGQYVTQDPAGLTGSLNYYAYADGNPIKYVDPTGQFAMLLPLIPAIAGTDLLIGAGLGGALIGLDKVFNRPGKTPNTGEPGSCHVNPGSGQERKYGSDGKPEYDIDWDHDHGQGSPHGHNWDKGKRDSGWPISSWPHGRTAGQNP